MSNLPLPPGDDVYVKDFGEKSFIGQKSHREVVRKTLAYRLLWLISAVTAGVIIAVVLGRISIEVAKDLLVFNSTLIGVFATAVGFYYGSRDND